MGCDIHLKIERRRKNTPNGNWFGVGFRGEFSSRIYGMFACMANVRDYGYKLKVKFEPRGLPADVSYATRRSFELLVTEDENAVEWASGYCLREDAEKWVEKGYSHWTDDEHNYISDPDLHSYSWLTTQELRQCFDCVFKQENGEYKPLSDYVEWLGLVSLCESIESTGKYECRVVFAFDN